MNNELNPDYNEQAANILNSWRPIHKAYKKLMEILKKRVIPYNNLFMLGNRKIVLECDSPEDCRIVDGDTINGFPIEVRKGEKFANGMFCSIDEMEQDIIKALKESGVEECGGITTIDSKKEIEIYLHRDFNIKADNGTLISALNDVIPSDWSYTILTYRDHIDVSPSCRKHWNDSPITSTTKYFGEGSGGVAVCGYLPSPVYLYSRIGLLGETIAISKEDYESNYEVPRNGMVDDDYMNKLRASEAPMGSNTELKEFIDSLPEEVDRTYDEIEALQCQGRDKPKENKEQDKFLDKITIELTPYHRDNWLWVLKEIQDNPILLAAFNTGDFLGELGPILAKTFRGTEKYSPNAQPGDATKRLLDIIQHKLTKKD